MRSSKVCTYCGEDKALSEYNNCARGGLLGKNPRCKSCRSILNAENYQRGVGYMNEYLREHYQHTCQICNEQFPREILHFHHVNPEEKELKLEAAAWRGGKSPSPKVLDEVKKCVVLCSNCHILEHIAMKNEETLVGNKKAYSRYRNHGITSYESVDGGDDGPEDRRGTKLSLSV
jgi:hypothetical protein